MAPSPLDVSAVSRMPWALALGVQGFLDSEGVGPLQPLLVQLLHVAAGLGEPHRDVGVDAFHLLQQSPVRAPVLALGLASAV